jgi:hypothetical protein
MKRLVVLLLILIAVPLLADDRDRTPRRTLVDDVIRMTTAGVNDDAIVEFVRKSDERIEVTADDLIALTDAKVSKDVIKMLIDIADDRDGGRPRERERERVVVERSYVTPYWGWGDPFYDPFWYGPRLSIGFGFGGYGYPRYGGRVITRGGHGGHGGHSGHGGRHH